LRFGLAFTRGTFSNDEAAVRLKKWRRFSGIEMVTPMVRIIVV
jgi:hypothetical protein